MATSSTDTKATHTPNETERRLLECALTLFAEKGYNGTSVRDIIESAGVTRPVLYYYFQSKEALFRRLIADSFAGSRKALQDILASVQGCRERLKAFVRMEFRSADVEPQLIALVLQAFFSRTEETVRLYADDLMRDYVRLIATVFADGIGKGELGGGEPESLALAFASLVDMHIIAKQHVPETELSDAFADGLVDLFMDGACGEGVVRPALKTPFVLRDANR